MGVSRNGGIPKWLVFVRENPLKMDDLGVAIFQETTIWKAKAPSLTGRPDVDLHCQQIHLSALSQRIGVGN